MGGPDPQKVNICQNLSKFVKIWGVSENPGPPMLLKNVFILFFLPEMTKYHTCVLDVYSSYPYPTAFPPFAGIFN